MEDYTIYSIGHGSKKIEDFLEELNTFGIEYLIDIRSMPYSKHNSQYNQNELKFFLKDNGIKYVYMGDQLGGLPKDRSCYVEDKVDYDILKDKEFFLEGIQRIVNASENEVRVAIMCSESNPMKCHRSKLIGRELLKRHVAILHIISKEMVKDQALVMLEVTKGLAERNLFGEETNLTSRKKYS